MAALAYLAANGARTPLLALRALGRPRNLASVILPAVALGTTALVLGHVARGAGADGALIVAMSPAPLLGPGLVGRMRGRSDLAGALVLGTIVLAILIAGSRGALASEPAVVAVEAFGLAAMFANVAPTLRDRILLPLRWVSWTSALTVVGAAAVRQPPDTASVAVALVLIAAGALAAAAVARVLGRDVVGSVAGAGLRDPVLAISLAALASPPALATPVAYGLLSVVLAALASLRR